MSGNNEKISISDHELRILLLTLTKLIKQRHQKWHIVFTVLISFALGCLVMGFFLGIGKKQEKTFDHSALLLETTNKTIAQVQSIRSSVNNLETTVRSNKEELSELKKTTNSFRESLHNDIDILASDISLLKQKISSIKNTSDYTKPLKSERASFFSTTEKQVCPNQYITYIHFSQKNNSDFFKNLAIILRKEGYKVPAPEHIQHSYCEIRYFHAIDRKGALLLKDHVQQFISDQTGIHHFNLPIQDLSRIYPQAQQGSLELWIRF